MKDSSALQNQMEKHFLVTTAVLVVFLGLPALYSMLKPPHSSDSLAAQSPGKTDRRIASVSLEHDDVPQNEFNQSVSMDVSCQGPLQLGDVQVGHLRFRGAFCGSLIETVEVKNITNGFTAAVIALRDNQFTTDFMDLTEGENKIQISRKTDLGVQVQDVTVRRAPAAIKSNQ